MLLWESVEYCPECETMTPLSKREFIRVGVFAVALLVAGVTLVGGRRSDAPFVPPAGLPTLSLPKGARLAVQHGFSLHAGVRVDPITFLEKLAALVLGP